MGTDLERHQQQPNGLVTHQPAPDSWIAVVADVAKFADYVAMTEFVPAALRGKPAAITAAILSGREMGLGPMASLKHVQMVEGTPSVSAEMARALVQSQGHDIRFREMTTTRCVVEGRRRGEEEWTVVTWTIDDARKAGLLDAGKSGKHRFGWVKYPRRMLIARASGELCHLKFADCISGMPFLEELEDEGLGGPSQVVENGQVAAPAKRTARRRNTPAKPPDETVPPGEDSAPAIAEPPLPGEPDYDEPAQAPKPSDQLTPGQSKKLNILLRDVGCDDRPQRLHAASVIVGRRLGSSSELTKQEAGTLIDTLEQVAAGPDPAQRLADLLETVTRVEQGGDSEPRNEDADEGGDS